MWRMLSPSKQLVMHVLILLKAQLNLVSVVTLRINSYGKEPAELRWGDVF